MSALPVWLAFALGIVVGAWLAWERFLRRERPTINVVVTPEVARQINKAMVEQWLDARGLCWMPKGPDFKAKAKP